MTYSKWVYDSNGCETISALYHFYLFFLLTSSYSPPLPQIFTTTNHNPLPYASIDSSIFLNHQLQKTHYASPISHYTPSNLVAELPLPSLMSIATTADNHNNCNYNQSLLLSWNSSVDHQNLSINDA